LYDPDRRRRVKTRVNSLSLEKSAEGLRPVKLLKSRMKWDWS